MTPALNVTPDQLVNGFKSFIKDYPVGSTADVLDQDDWEAWRSSPLVQVVTRWHGMVSWWPVHNDLPGLWARTHAIASCSEWIRLCDTLLGVQTSPVWGMGCYVSLCARATEDTCIASLVVRICPGSTKPGSLAIWALGQVHPAPWRRRWIAKLNLPATNSGSSWPSKPWAGWDPEPLKHCSVGGTCVPFLITGAQGSRYRHFGGPSFSCLCDVSASIELPHQKPSSRHTLLHGWTWKISARV